MNTGEQQLGSWHEQSYVAQWADEDVVADMLDLPRKLSAALVADDGVEVEHVIDLGSGHGPYLALFLRTFPAARGTWVDSSEPMLELARERLAEFGDRIEYVVADVERLAEVELEPAQVIVSSRALHHSSPEVLTEIYRACFEATAPGGFLFNLDHVGAQGEWDGRLRSIRSQFVGKRRSELAPHRDPDRLATMEEHLERIAAAGYETPDVAWRMFYTVLLAGHRAGH